MSDVERALGAMRGGIAALPDALAVPRVVGRPAPAFSVRPPGSKSLTNRALILAALGEGESMLGGALVDADDTRRMLGALGSLGVEATAHATGRIVVRGVGGRFPRGGEVFLNNAGTATRFLIAASCLAAEPVVIDGNERMRERPQGELIALLRGMGIVIDELGEPGRVPVRVHPRRVVGGEVRVGATMSSQFVSAVLMLGPWSERGVEVVFDAPPTSEPYVRMTLGLVERLGGAVSSVGEPMERASVGPGGLTGFVHEVEPDASGATYFWGLAAVVPGMTCRVEGLGTSSAQGDARFAEVIQAMGATVQRGDGSTTVVGAERLEAIDADLGGMPDAAMTVAAVACFADGASRLRGLRTLRVKETDRLEALRAELSKLGASVRIESGAGDESLVIEPPAGGIAEGEGAPAVEIETYDDHRMAMALAVVAARRGNVVIRDPACVRKTYPGFWEHLARAYDAEG